MQAHGEPAHVIDDNSEKSLIKLPLDCPRAWSDCDLSREPGPWAPGRSMDGSAPPGSLRLSLVVLVAATLGRGLAALCGWRAPGYSFLALSLSFGHTPGVQLRGSGHAEVLESRAVAVLGGCVRRRARGCVWRRNLLSRAD